MPPDAFISAQNAFDSEDLLGELTALLQTP